MPPIGIVAGWGRFPVVVAETLKQQGYAVFCLGIANHADETALRAVSDGYQEVGIARMRAHMRFFQKHGVTQATLAGKFFKTLLLERFFWLKHLPDWGALKLFFPHFVARTKDRKDDTLLAAVVEGYAMHGITIAPPTDYAPELLVKQGHLSGRWLTRAQQKDIEFGWRLAKEMGRLDVGQSVSVKGQAVIAVEAIEGTDESIRRAGRLCPTGNFTVVKVAKPQQDMRFDVPTIGVGTLETLVEAGARVLAVEAEKTIILDEKELIAFANRHKITVVAVSETSFGQRADAA